MTHDRGAYNEITFMRCERGFVIRTSGMERGYTGAVYAFDRAEDAAAWIVEQYRVISDDGPSPPTFANTPNLDGSWT